jgi:hypothetical protein
VFWLLLLVLLLLLLVQLASDNALWRLQFERSQGGWKVACNVGAEPLPSGTKPSRYLYIFINVSLALGPTPFSRCRV